MDPEFQLPTPLMRFRRRPSGCLIEAMDNGNGYLKVTWVEHAEVDDRFVHQLHKPLVNYSLMFGAQRWLGTLGSQCERIASVLASIPYLANIFYNGGRTEEIVHLGTGRDVRGRVLLFKVFGTSDGSRENMMIIQETSTDALESYVIFAPLNVRIKAYMTEIGNNGFAVMNNANLVRSNSGTDGLMII